MNANTLIKTLSLEAALQSLSVNFPLSKNYVEAGPELYTTGAVTVFKSYRARCRRRRFVVVICSTEITTGDDPSLSLQAQL